MTQIIKSQDYESFKFYSWNRKKIKEIDVKRIMSSIEHKNMLHLCPILIGKNNYVCDGQHRMLAAKNLNIPFYYIKDESITYEDVIALNSSSKRWQTEDYIHAFVEQGHEEYIKLDTFFKESNIPLSCGLGLLDTGGARRKLIYSGNFEMTKKTSYYLDGFVKFRDRWVETFPVEYIYRYAFTSSFTKAMMRKGFDLDIFINKIKFKGYLLACKASAGQVSALMEAVYNFKNHKPVQLYTRHRMI